MRRQLSSNFLIIFFISLLMLPLLRLPYHGYELFLALVLATFFVRIKKSYGAALLSWALIGTIVLFAQWGLAQFSLQHDLGLYLLGESRISPEMPAVAKFSFDNGKLLRSYGPFEHANTFGGVMLLGLLLLTQIKNLKGNFWIAAWVMISIGLFLSFSRSALAGFFILNFMALIQHRVRWLPVSLISLLFIITLSPLWYYRLTDRQDVAVSEREIFFEWWREVVSHHSLLRGVGPGNYEQALERTLQNLSKPYQEWQIAPVHSVLLILLAEWGVILGGLILLIWLLSTSAIVILTLAPAFLLDHYFLTQLAPLTYLLLVSILVRRWKLTSSRWKKFCVR